MPYKNTALPPVGAPDPETQTLPSVCARNAHQAHENRARCNDAGCATEPPSKATRAGPYSPRNPKTEARPRLPARRNDGAGAPAWERAAHTLDWRACAATPAEPAALPENRVAPQMRRSLAYRNLYPGSAGRPAAPLHCIALPWVAGSVQGRHSQKGFAQAVRRPLGSRPAFSQPPGAPRPAGLRNGPSVSARSPKRLQAAARPTPQEKPTGSHIPGSVTYPPLQHMWS